MATPIRVLIVEDSETDVLIIMRELRRGGYEPVFERVETVEGLKAALEKQAWDIILADHRLPKFNDIDALKQVQEQGLDLPFIIVSGTIGEEAAVAAMKAGAHDYVLKENLGRLVPAVNRELEESEIRRKRRQAEEALRESEERYRTLVRNANETIMVVQDERIKFYNPKAEELFGYTGETLPDDLNFLALVHPEDREKISDRYQRRLQGEEFPHTYSYRIIDWKGKMKWVELNAALITWEGRPAILVLLQDISDRKNTEEKILFAKEEWERTFDSVPDLIAIVGDDFRITRVNRPMAERLNRTPQELIGKFCYEMFHGLQGPLSFCPHSQILRENKEISAEFSEPLLGGYFFLTGTPLPGTNSVIHVFRDITDRKKSEEKVLEGGEKLKKAIEGIIQAMAATVEVKDPYTAGHQRRVADLARAIAKEMGFSDDRIEGIHMAGMIHDLGKLSIPAEILSKPTQLSEIEFNLIKVHPWAGYEILKEIDFPWPIARIVFQHHERINGSGYPMQITGDEILPETKILAVADVVEAMASYRPYRPALGIDKALEEIENNQGVLYDPEAVRTCLSLFREKGYALS